MLHGELLRSVPKAPPGPQGSLSLGQGQPFGLALLCHHGKRHRRPAGSGLCPLAHLGVTPSGAKPDEGPDGLRGAPSPQAWAAAAGFVVRPTACPQAACVQSEQDGADAGRLVFPHVVSGDAGSGLGAGLAKGAVRVQGRERVEGRPLGWLALLPLAGRWIGQGVWPRGQSQDGGPKRDKSRGAQAQRKLCGGAES